jgi:L-threonylcarbamoyladenylate synthase
MNESTLHTIVGKDIQHAITLLQQDEVVAVPTETVYGLSGNAFSEAAVCRIFATKNRPLHNPLIVHIAQLDRLPALVTTIPPLAWQLLEAFSPGPLTLLLPKKDIIPDIVTAGLPDVAIRIPAHPMIRELLLNLDFPLAAPSANPFGYISPTTPDHVLKQLVGKIAYILDGGDCDTGIESTVVGFRNGTPIIHRLGAISVADIQRIAGAVIIQDKENEKPASPGMLLHHYSPHTPLVFTNSPEALLKDADLKKTGVIAFRNYIDHIPAENQFVLSSSGDVAEAAHNLYQALHYLDARKLSLIIAEALPEEGIGAAVNDRLRRAAAK